MIDTIALEWTRRLVRTRIADLRVMSVAVWIPARDVARSRRDQTTATPGRGVVVESPARVTPLWLNRPPSYALIQARPQSPLTGSSAAALCIIAVLLARILPKIIKKVRNRKEGSPMAKTLTWIGYTADTISLATAGAAVGGRPENALVARGL